MKNSIQIQIAKHLPITLGSKISIDDHSVLINEAAMCGGVTTILGFIKKDSQMNIDKIETQKEETNTSEVPNSSEWNGEGLPPVGALCKVNRDSFVYRVMYSSVFVVIVQNLDNDNTTAHGMDIVLDLYKGNYTFSKPETPQQRNDRERLALVSDICEDLFGEMASQCREDVVSTIDAMVCGGWVDKTNYRKGEK